MRHLAKLLPDATVEMLEGAGHLPWLDDPVGVGRRISAFVTTRDADEETRG